MPLTYNSNSPKKINFNGQPLKRVRYNGTEVWKAGGEIPVGGILPYTSNTPPAGYDFWNYGIDRALRGEGGNTPYLGNIGTGEVTLTGETDERGEHLGEADSLYAYGNPTITFGTGSYRYHNNSAGGHVHPMSHTIAYTPPSLRAPMIIKVNEPGQIPANAFVMALQALDDSALSFVPDYVGRVLAAANSLATVGSNPTSASFYTATRGAHRHSATQVTNDTIQSTFGPDAFDEEERGAHKHLIQASIAAINMRRMLMAFYQASEATLARPETVIGYMGDGSNLGSEWEIIDLSDRLIELSAEADAGTAKGDDTVDWDVDSVSEAGAHGSHGGTNRGHRTSYSTAHGGSVGDHPHTVPTRGGTVSPEAFGVKFIRYVG